MYKLLIFFGETSASSVLRVTDRAVIPFDPANSDYQMYLNWLKEGNIPEYFNYESDSV